METRAAIKRVMDARNVFGKELVAEKIFTRSRLTRVLSGETNPTFDEIRHFCKYCGITMAEFEYFLQEDTELEAMILDYRKYIKGIHDSEKGKAQELVEYYKAKRFVNLSSFLQYIRVENFIIPKLEGKAFSGLPPECLDFIVENIGKGKMLTATEFYILAGTAREIPYEFLKETYQKFSPLDFNYLFGVTAEERNAAREFISNIFDGFSEHGNAQLARQSLDELSSYLKHLPNLRFELVLKLNENFLDLSTKLDRKIIVETETYLEALRNLGEVVFAEAAEYQLENIVSGNGVKVFDEKMPSD
ncbi:helix-turn-helix transcriptional regulator [Enterococcus faecium]|uniref:helix-turn-helix domain-containing protein n=1 Tax=Enterococcus faecium TaxID=1352 RepID=UPI0035145B71